MRHAPLHRRDEDQFFAEQAFQAQDQRLIRQSLARQLDHRAVGVGGLGALVALRLKGAAAYRRGTVSLPTTSARPTGRVTGRLTPDTGMIAPANCTRPNTSALTDRPRLARVSASYPPQLTDQSCISFQATFEAGTTRAARRAYRFVTKVVACRDVGIDLGHARDRADTHAINVASAAGLISNYNG
jgi:hypothetical protein